MKSIPVTRRALLQRINRKLKKVSEVLRATRGENARADFGDYFILDLDRNAVLHKAVDLEKLGRKKGVLKKFERLVD